MPPEQYVWSQTYAAELAVGQVADFGLCRAAATWFYNEANASQLDRYRHRVPVESLISLSYAVAVARKAGVEFRYHATMRPIGDVPAVMLHGALRQLSASWTRHLRMRQEGRNHYRRGSARCAAAAACTGRCRTAPARARSASS